MLTRNVIGQAQGMLMERHGLTADEAFDLLRRHSQQTNVKLVVLARRIADSGIVPDVGDRD
jgi:AmiR/NasT family two-component response regulator